MSDVRTHVVAWSGGFDSTLMLLNILEDDLKDEPILVFSMDNRLTGPAKCDREVESREKIKAYIKEKYPDHEIEYATLHVDCVVESNLTRNNQGISHPIFWVCSLFPFMPDNSVLYFGYIKGDVALSHRDDIDGAVSRFCNLQYRKRVSTYYPLMYHSKYDVIAQLLEKHPDVLEMCTSCEGSGHRCRRCDPCEHMIDALIQGVTRGSHEKECKQLLEDWYHMGVTVTYPEGLKKGDENEVRS